MHALPSHPRHPLVAGLVALLVAVIVMAAASPDLGSLDLSIGGATATEAPRVEQPLPAGQAVPGPSQPAWVTDPLKPPLQALAARG